LEKGKNNVFAKQTVGDETLEQMTQQNEREFANHKSMSESTDFVKLKYAWITCQQVSQVKLSHNLFVHL